MTRPYAETADHYWRAGWRGILPLPPRAKKNPPPGYTGAGGIYPSYADVDAWATGPEGEGNICLRLPPNIIGVDVDAYGDKPGLETLNLAEARLGKLPPTWATSSRGDGVSGIRLYRVPEGLAWPGEIGLATEIIQTRHRYAIVWPSVHPVTGGTYIWTNPAGEPCGIPDPDRLPLLPQAWVDAYTGGEEAVDVKRVAVGHSDAVAWLVSRPDATGDMCPRMGKAVDQMRHDLAGSAHNAARDTALRISRLADEGHHGAVHAIAAARALFLKDATNPDRSLLGKTRRTDSEAVWEWGEIVASAVGIVVADPTGIQTCDCYGQLTDAIAAANPSPNVDHAAVAAEILRTDQPTSVHTDPATVDTGHKMLRHGGAFILDAPDHVQSIWGDDDSCLWAKDEALMIVGPPGVGKTTLTGQVLRGLLGLQTAVLDLTVNPVDGRVLYLAMDRPRQIARGLRRAFQDHEREVLDQRLRVWEGPPPGDVAKHPDLLLSLAQLAEADALIIDSLKDAAVGLSEDEVGAAYNRARQTALAGGVQVLELHHMTKRNATGGAPTSLEDLYGSVWLSAGAGSVLLLSGQAGDLIVEMRHLKQPAAEVGPWRLKHDHEAGVTTVWHKVDLVQMLGSAGQAGVTAKAVAASLFETEKPSESQVEKARRKLDKLVKQDHATRGERAAVGESGRPQIVWRSPHALLTEGVSTNLLTANHAGTSETGKTAGQEFSRSPHADSTPGFSRSLPPLEGGERETPSLLDDEIDCNGCGQPTGTRVIETGRGYCLPCARERR